MEREILDAMDDLGVEVLYACESGSHAWGFASPDSDWDVRFVFAHPRDGYLAIEPPEETIDLFLPNDLDLAGWDLRKMLGLLRKSNPSLLEWLHSPIVYAEFPGFGEEMRGLARRAFSPNAGLYHYRSMAGGNLAKSVPTPEAPFKKYLYVLRPLLAARWIESTGTIAPVPIAELLDLTPPEHRSEVDELLRLKKAAGERDVFAGMPALHAWMVAEHTRLGTLTLAAPPALPQGALDAAFRLWLR